MPPNRKAPMSTRRAVAYTVLAFAAMFAFQLLWTAGRLDQLRELGRRGLRRRGGSGGALGGSRLDRLALDANRGVGSGDGHTPGAVGKQQQQQNVAAGGVARWSGGAAPMPDPALIVFCFNRSDYLNQTLHSLLGLRGLDRYTVYVSQDGDAPEVAEVVGTLAPHFLRTARGFSFWQKAPRVAALNPNQAGHAWLAQHYKWGLDRVFLGAGPEGRRHSHVVIAEDDMLFSPDFLLYFEATAPLLDADPTLWCVSSWNDNGFTTGHDWDVRRLFRTSYFPGLGWMMKRELWLELGEKWPRDHWDHWMRDEEVSHGRECVCPEVNRNKNIGEVGANMNKQAFKRYLKTMSWNEDEEVVDYGDLSLLMRPAYTAALEAEIAAAEPWNLTYRRDAPQPQPGKTYLLAYTIEQYMRISLRMKLWPYPRGHHQHVSVIPWKGARLLLADRRFCPLLPKELQLPPTPGMTPVPAAQWQSCRDACEGRGMRCYAKDFWWLNSCAVMRKHFPCESGCTVELGPDVPAYVADPNQTLYRYCLITQKASTCLAKHAATARLCACVPILDEEEKKGRRRLAAAGSGAGGDTAAAQQQQLSQQAAAAGSSRVASHIPS